MKKNLRLFTLVARLKRSFLFIFLLASGQASHAQTTLSPGGLMLSVFNTDVTDGFSVVLLTPISAGTTVNFSDVGWDPATTSWLAAPPTSEMFFTWTSSQAHPCGTEITFTTVAGGATSSTGSVSNTGGRTLNFTAAGESLLAFQGSQASPSFITGFTNYSAGWGWNTGSPVTSCGLPATLTNGTNALWLNDLDNAKYNCSGNPTSALPATLRAALADASKWVFDPDIPYAATGCITGCSAPALVATQSQTNITCNGAPNGTATVVASGGTPPYTYSWSPSGGTSAAATGLLAGNYTCTITDAATASIIKSFSITEPAATPGSNSYSLPASNQTVINTVSNNNYVSGGCQLLSSVVASGASPVSGSVTNKIWIEGTVPTQSGIPYVQRHYEITPAVNASAATGTVTLYFTQAEFDNFNAHAASVLNLPVNAADNAGKANLRIGKYSGTSGNGTGLPSTYSSSALVINPDDNNIVWNAVSNAWEITFAVVGFSGFIVQTNMFTLPVAWVSFTVRRQGQSAILNWSTATEQNTKDFVVQHSIDGISWSTTTTLVAAGNSSSLRNYTFVHDNTGKGYNYYRIMQTDLDGKISYSSVRVINLSVDNASFDIAGNVISNGVLQLQVHQRTTISFYEINGKLLWKKQFTPGLQIMNAGSNAKGIYLLKADGKAQKILIQ